MVSILSNPMALGYGISFLIIASVWSILTDRAGRPGMESTHKTIQAYLASQGNDFTEAEEIMEQRSSETKVSTSQIRLSSSNGRKRISNGDTRNTSRTISSSRRKQHTIPNLQKFSLISNGYA